MPYAIRFQSCRLQLCDTDRTGDPSSLGVPKYVNLGLSDAERQAVQSLLQRHGARRAGPGDRVRVNLLNGTVADVDLVGLHANKPCTSGSLSAEEVSLPLLTLAFELARDGNLMFTPEDFPKPLVVSERLRHELIVPFPRVQSVFTAVALWKLLRPPVNEEVELPANQAENTPTQEPS